jgi:hypothetical protein
LRIRLPRRAMNRTPLDEWLKKSHLYLNVTAQEDKLKRQRAELRDDLKTMIMWSEQDENGNYNYEFPDPISVDGETYYRGLQAQRRVSEYINDETAFQIVDEYNLWDRCVKEEIVYNIDYDAMYAANQEGLIPDDVIDSMIEHDVTYSLVKVK